MTRWIAILGKFTEARRVFQTLPVFCTAARPITLSKWNGKHPPDKNMTIEVVPTGTTLRIVMFSRFGDVGLTDNLLKEYGYHTRVMPEPEAGHIKNIRETEDVIDE